MKKVFVVAALTFTVLLTTGCAGLEPDQMFEIATIVLGE